MYTQNGTDTLLKRNKKLQVKKTNKKHMCSNLKHLGTFTLRKMEQNFKDWNRTRIYILIWNKLVHKHSSKRNKRE